MARKRSSRGLIGKILFILIVAVFGYALAVSGNMRNPFNVLTEITSLTTSGEQGSAPEGDFQMQARNSGEERPARSEGDFGGGGADAQTTIQWDQIGGVLFNLWFLMAAAAFVMMVERPINAVLTPLRRALKARTPHPAVQLPGEDIISLTRYPRTSKFGKDALR